MTTVELPKATGAHPTGDELNSVTAPLNPFGVPDCRLLFVGGDPSWLSQSERDLRCLEPTWQFRRVAEDQIKGDLATASFDALILDERVAEGAKWVRQVSRQFPKAICLARCDLHDAATAAEWSQTGATLVAHDASITSLVATLKRIMRLREWMHDESIRRLLPLIRKLPTAPKLHTQITEELRSPKGSLEVVAQLISQEPVMAAKILQVANSAFFGLAHEVNDTREAVMVLGAERITGLILLAGVFSQYSGGKCPGFSPEPVWTHSVQVGIFARAIALGETRDARNAEAAFTAGLLHDIGKLVLAGNVPEMYDTVRRLQAARKCPPRTAELEVMGTTHAELGACLLATWGLPLPILEAIAWHHHPEHYTDRGFSLLAAIHCANVFAQETDPGGGEAPKDRIHVEFLLKAGLGDCRNRWRALCGLEAQAIEATAGEQLRRRREAKEN